MQHPVSDETKVVNHFRHAIAGEMTSAHVTEIKRCDGSGRPVEITTEVADLSDGRRLALGIFRPI